MVDKMEILAGNQTTLWCPDWTINFKSNGNVAFPNVGTQPKGVIEVNSSKFKVFSDVFQQESANIFNVSGDPLEFTIECDYKTINVSGICHRLHIIGICNQVNLTGNLHSVAFEGFSNEVNFWSGSLDARCAVWGNVFSYTIKNSNGIIVSNNGPKPKKIPFPEPRRGGQRHRFTWKSAEPFSVEYFNIKSLPQPQFDEEDWEDEGYTMPQSSEFYRRTGRKKLSGENALNWVEFDN